VTTCAQAQFPATARAIRSAQSAARPIIDRAFHAAQRQDVKFTARAMRIAAVRLFGMDATGPVAPDAARSGRSSALRAGDGLGNLQPLIRFYGVAALIASTLLQRPAAWI